MRQIRKRAKRQFLKREIKKERGVIWTRFTPVTIEAWWTFFKLLNTAA